MGLLLLLTIGAVVATVQIVVERVSLRDAIRLYVLAGLAALFGGFLVKAITQEAPGVVSLGSAAVAAAIAAGMLVLWHVIEPRTAWDAPSNPPAAPDRGRLPATAEKRPSPAGSARYPTTVGTRTL